MYIRKHVFKRRWWIFIVAVVLFVFMVGCEKRAWKKAESENTISAYEGFVERYPDSSLAKVAHLKLEALYFERAQSINHTNAYEEFLRRYPKSPMAVKARSKIDELTREHYFNKAQSTNTIPAYEDFLQKYPKGPLADKARLKVEKFENERHPAFKHTRIAKIIVKQTYGKAGDINLPFSTEAGKFLYYTTLKEVNADAKNYDVILKIQANGRAVGDNYTGQISGYHYSGASLSGTVSLMVSGSPAYKKSFSGYVSPPFMIHSHYSSQSSAPFYRAYNESDYISKIFEIMGEVYGTRPLLAAMKDNDSDIREAANKAFDRLKVIYSVEPLIAALKDDDPSIQKRAADKLMKIKDRRSINSLVTALQDEDSFVRIKAIEVLDNLHWIPKTNNQKILYLIAKGRWNDCAKIGKLAVKPLIAILRDEKREDQTKVAAALGKINDRQAVEALIEALDDSNYYVRQGAAEALGNIKDRRTIKPLINALKDKSWNVRLKAAKALDKFGWSAKNDKQKIFYFIAKRQFNQCVKIGKPAIEPLIATLKDKSWNVRWDAVLALRKITKQPFGEDYEAWSKWWKKNKKKYQ